MIRALLVLLLCGPAAAGPVTFPPEGAQEVGLLTCVIEDCPDWIFWIGAEPAFDDLPVLVPDVLLADEVVGEPDEARAQAFAGALEAARQAVLEDSPMRARTSLDDAGRILGAWRGSPDNQALFSLWFLRGVVADVQQQSEGAVHFRQAAAVAWNRSVAPPPGMEQWAEGYYAALAGMLEGGTGTMVVDAGRHGVTYALDGVALGEAPIRVQLFPGEHRLTAVDSYTGMQWRREVVIESGRTTTTRARFPGGADDRWAAGGMALAIDLRAIEPELAELLAAWARRHGLKRIRLIRLDPSRPEGELDEIEQEAGETLSTFIVRQVGYAPQLRRFEELPEIR